MLLIADISSHNTVTNWGAFLGAVDGVIPKISEGIGYAWAGASNALTQARNAGKCVGVYHFARVNDPIAEADYFLSQYTHRPGEVIVLDWEPGMSVPVNPDDWAYAWCQRVIAATGVVPMLYLNHWYATVQSSWTRTRALGCGLWSAWYGANTGVPLAGEPSFAPWSEAMWQYTSNGSLPGVSGPVDLSQFYGNADQWRAYGGVAAPTPPAPIVMEDDDMIPFFKADGRGVAVILGGVYVSLTGPQSESWGVLLGKTPQHVDGNVFDDLRNSCTSTSSSSVEIGALGDLAAKVGQVQTPQIDEAKLATALLADPQAVDALGKAIAANLQLTPRSA